MKEVFEMELVFNGRSKKFVRTLNDQVKTLLKRIELAMINIKTNNSKPPAKKEKPSPPSETMKVDTDVSDYPYVSDQSGNKINLPDSTILEVFPYEKINERVLRLNPEKSVKLLRNPPTIV